MATPPTPRTPRSIVPRRSRILVATADPGVRRILMDEAERAGSDVVLAEDGADVLEWLGLELLVPGAMSFAVLDASLPGYPGLALASSARANRIGVPIALVQRKGRPVSAATALKLDLLGVLDEPVDPLRVRDLLRRAMRRPPARTVAARAPLGLEAAVSAR